MTKEDICQLDKAWLFLYNEQGQSHVRNIHFTDFQDYGVLGRINGLWQDELDSQAKGQDFLKGKLR